VALTGNRRITQPMGAWLDLPAQHIRHASRQFTGFTKMSLVNGQRPMNQSEPMIWMCGTPG
jgi:hypothetical protein